MLLLLDGFAFAAAFWGAIKVGAVAVPVNTLCAPPTIATCSKTAAPASSSSAPNYCQPFDRSFDVCRRLRHVIVVGAASESGVLSSTT